MMNHATFKASLFMATGVVDHETGTRDLRAVERAAPRHADHGDCWRLVAAGAMAGVPLLNGFLSKEMFFAESIAAGSSNGLRFALPLLATLASMFSVAYSVRFIHEVFFGPSSAGSAAHAARADTRMLVPGALLVLACLLVGIFPEQNGGADAGDRRGTRSWAPTCPRMSSRCGTGSRYRCS